MTAAPRAKFTQEQIDAARNDPSVRVYQPDGVFLDRFIHDNSRVCVIEGPISSGKTAAAGARLVRHAQEAWPWKDGIRRSKFLITRPTYGQLRDTTARTVEHWWGKFGRFHGDKPFYFDFKHGDVEAQFIFLALDGPIDIPKIRSFEFTGAWVNENQYFDFRVFKELLSRTGRYPPKEAIMHNFAEGTPEEAMRQVWSGLIADMNAPPEDFWTEYMFRKVPLPPNMTASEARGYQKPDNWRFILQPPACWQILEPKTLRPTGRYAVNTGQNPKYPYPAENIKWCDGGAEYYENLLNEETETWIDTNLRNIPGALSAGRAVYPEFSKEWHVAPKAIEPYQGAPIGIGIDPGKVRSGAVFAQEVRGQLRVLQELVVHDIKAEEFGSLIRRYLAKYFPDHFADERFYLWGDPFGEREQFNAEKTAYEILKHACGLDVKVPPKANFRRVKAKIDIRKDALSHLLKQGLGDGTRDPKIIIDPRCKVLTSGLQGGYQWKQNQDGSLPDVPRVDKDQHGYSEAVEALEYLVVGDGYGANLMGAHRPAIKVQNAMPDRNAVFTRGGRARHNLQRARR